VYEGSSARLPVVIEEGPVFRVERINFEGAASQPEDALRTAFGVEPGSVLPRASAAAAVRGLGEYYRARGFSSATVSTASRLERERGAAVLTVTVREGPQQILRDVTVEGIHRTNS